MALAESHPNPWLYGGILERIEWDTGPGTIRRWDGRQQEIDRGDFLMVLRTPVAVVAVGVERQ